MGVVICSNLAWAGLAEKLGYDEQAKILIIHADDAGMCHSVKSSYLNCHEGRRGYLGCCDGTSGLGPGDSCLGQGKSRTGSGPAPNLDQRMEALPMATSGGSESGCRSVAEVVANATPAEIETEIRAQIDRAIAFGINPTHVDSHMGTLFATPEFLSIYLKTAMCYGIPPMIPDPSAPQVKQLWPREDYNIPKHYSIVWWLRVYHCSIF